MRERIRNGNQKEEVSDRVLQGYYSREDSEIKTLQAEAQKKLHNDKISEVSLRAFSDFFCCLEGIS